MLPKNLDIEKILEIVRLKAINVLRKVETATYDDLKLLFHDFDVPFSWLAVTLYFPEPCPAKGDKDYWFAIEAYYRFQCEVKLGCVYCTIIDGYSYYQLTKVFALKRVEARISISRKSIRIAYEIDRLQRSWLPLFLLRRLPWNNY